MPEEVNVFKQNLEDKPVERRDTPHTSDFPVGVIQQRAIHEGFIVFRGLVADLPSDGTTEKEVYFAEDESKLYIWNTVNEAWESATLS